MVAQRRSRKAAASTGAGSPSSAWGGGDTGGVCVGGSPSWTPGFPQALGVGAGGGGSHLGLLLRDGAVPVGVQLRAGAQLRHRHPGEGSWGEGGSWVLCPPTWRPPPRAPRPPAAHHPSPSASSSAKASSARAASCAAAAAARCSAGRDAVLGGDDTNTQVSGGPPHPPMGPRRLRDPLTPTHGDPGAQETPTHRDSGIWGTPSPPPMGPSPPGPQGVRTLPAPLMLLLGRPLGPLGRLLGCPQGPHALLQPPPGLLQPPQPPLPEGSAPRDPQNPSCTPKPNASQPRTPHAPPKPPPITPTRSPGPLVSPVRLLCVTCPL